MSSATPASTPTGRRSSAVRSRIANRAISTLIQTQGIGDLYRIYVAADRDKIDFNLASIPETFKTELKQPFDTAYMRALFKLGYDLGAKGYHWAKLPPGYRELGAGPTLNSTETPTRGRSAADALPSGRR